MKNIDFLNDLNPIQRQSVECTEGPMMIIAGAGSGKTRVLTYRIAHLINKGADAFSILSLTFTNKAAREMKDRIHKLVGPEARNLWMGTFHSVFAKILRFEAEKLGYPANFTIYDSDDSKSLIKDVLKELGLDDKMYKPNLVLSRISAAKANLISVIEYQNNAEFLSEDKSAGKPKMGEIYERYNDRCFKAGAMDFDDLLFNTFVLFQKYPDVLYKYQNRFKYVMVDEYQDTNFAQYIIVRKLAAINRNICVVGDDAQSIYAFRGANIQNILNYEKDYPELQIFKLEQNYRSTKHIVNAANSVIKNNKEQLEKTVFTQNDHGDKIKVIKALSDNEEGYSVGQAIYQDRANFKMRYKDFAILYRTNSQSRAMEEALRRLNIPYRIFGGLSFYKRKEIKDLLAYFRLAINAGDEEALKRVINYPARGIGKTSLDRIIAKAGENNVSLWTIVSDPVTYQLDVNAGTRGKLLDFAAMVKGFNAMLITHNAYDLASHISQHSGLLKELYTDRSPEGVSHYENIQELLNGIKEFTESSDERKEVAEMYASENDGEFPETIALGDDLGVFMQDIALLTDADEKEEGDNDKVSLMTIHAAKGLEFPQVFVVGLEENLFPSHLSVQSRTELEEERRLFYVAITRAEKRLYLSYALSRYKWGDLMGCDPSRFLEELDPDTLEMTSPIPKRTESGAPEPSRWGGLGAGTQSGGHYKQPAKPAQTQTKPVPPASQPGIPRKLVPMGKAMNSTPAASNFESSDLSNLQVGSEVEHAKFGKGKILNLEGNSGDVKATIFFQGSGQKQLLLKFAKLKVLTP